MLITYRLQKSIDLITDILVSSCWRDNNTWLCALVTV